MIRKTKQTFILSNNKPVEILKVDYGKYGGFVHLYRRKDIFEALELPSNALNMLDMFADEHDIFSDLKDRMKYLKATALLLLPEKNQNSFKQRELISEIIRLNLIDTA